MSTQHRTQPLPAPAVDDVQVLRVGGRWEFRAGFLWVIFDMVTPTSHGLNAWTEVRWTAGEEGRLLYSGRMDLMGPRTASAVYRGVRDCLPGLVDPGWRDIISGCIYHVVKEHLEGDPLRTAHPMLQLEEGTWLVRGLWRTSGATSIAGFGESGKSLLAEAAAVSLCAGSDRLLGLSPAQQGPVLYLDWEGDEDVFSHRLALLLNGAGVNDPGTLKYRRERVPLYRSAPALERLIAVEGIIGLAIDSVSYARGGEIMGDVQASTMVLYQTLGHLGLPALLVDHRAKHADPKDRTPLGAVSNFNSLRLLWTATARPIRSGTDLRLHCDKSNYGRRPPDLAWDLTFDDRAVRFDPQSSVGVTSLEDPTDRTLGDQIVRLLEAGLAGMTTAEICEATGKPDGTVRKTLAREEEKSRVSRRDTRWVAVPRATDGENG